MPETVESFGQGLWELVKSAVAFLEPSLADAAGICLSITAILLLLSMVESMQADAKRSIAIAGAVGLGVLLLQPSNILIRLGLDTVRQISEYGKLLLPVMTGAMAAQGGVSTSTTLYVGTVFFDSVLSSVVSQLIGPLIYVFLCMGIVNGALGDDTLKKLQDFVKWLMVWLLKTVLYVFTGYMSITGVITGSADAAAVKAAKLTISGVVPVVGGILSDASEAVLVSAGAMKSAAGVYGILALLAILVGPFLKIGAQYVLLKMTAAICSVFGNKAQVKLVSDFSAAMGLVLAMTGTVCLLQLISTVCFMKGVG